MNREDIIRMAQEVGFVAYGEDAGEYRIPTPAFHGRLERFAALVAAHVRETEFKPDWNNYRQGLADGAAEEREACAKVCDEIGERMTRGKHCAAAIRARSNT